MADLALAEPAIEAAMKSLDTLDKKDLGNCKTMATPPKADKKKRKAPAAKPEAAPAWMRRVVDVVVASACVCLVVTGRLTFLFEMLNSDDAIWRQSARWVAASVTGAALATHVDAPLAVAEARWPLVGGGRCPRVAAAAIHKLCRDALGNSGSGRGRRTATQNASAWPLSGRPGSVSFLAAP